MTRYGRLALLVGTPILILAVIGAVYFQIYAGSHATRTAWMLTQDVAAGTLLTSGNVEQVTVADSGTSFLVLSQDPIAGHRRAGHGMRASHLLAPDDLMAADDQLVPVTFASSPGLQPGDTIDVYAVSGNGTIQVGRGVIVASSHAIWVSAREAPYWVALQAANAQLIAVQSYGADGGAADQVDLQQAIAALHRAAAGGGSASPAPTTSPAPAPSLPPPTAAPQPTPQPS